MSLLCEIITDLKETAVAGTTGAHAVGGHAGRLFGSGSKSPSFKRSIRGQSIVLQTTINARNRNTWKIIGEAVLNSDDEQSDMVDVVSKLDAAEKKAKHEMDTTPFGLEDENGEIVKVYVSTEDADEFEIALGALLAGQTDGDDDALEDLEIAEVLFRLKNKFNIADVVWPKIEGDEEEELDVDMDVDEFETENEADANSLDDPELDSVRDDTKDDPTTDVEMEPEKGTESVLQQVIDMMKMDAEARKLESEARSEEAKARAAEANAMAAASKVKQEEEVLDMEAYNAQQKKEKEEAKTLASLAKWKHEQAAKAEAKMAEEDEESGYTLDPHRIDRPDDEEKTTITKDELMNTIFNYLRAN